MGNNNRVCRLSPLAEADLEEIWLYTFRQWLLEQADDYCGNIITAIDGLVSGRNVAQRRGEALAREAITRRVDQRCPDLVSTARGRCHHD